MHLPPSPRGRGASDNPRSRFDKDFFEPSEEEIEFRGSEGVRTQLIEDTTQSIFSRNQSPDIPFTFSINPYRGCEHGCAYCYARPTHEYLGYSAGLDFETRIVIKRNAPQLLRESLSANSWKPQVVVMSGVTDPYQPIEKNLRITRGCLEVFQEFRNPVGLITKNAGILRDLDILGQLAEWNGVHVSISLTTLDPELARKMEPRTASPRQRLDVIRSLTEARIPVSVMQGPVIPGLTDIEMPKIIEAAAEAGARGFNYVLLRLPGAVEPIFLDWLERMLPTKRKRIEDRLRSLREGKLNNSRPGERMRGTGPWAENLRALEQVGLRRAGMIKQSYHLNTRAFLRPGGTQMDLFQA